MAEQEGSERMSRQSGAPFTDDSDVMKGMRVPESIQVNLDNNMESLGQNKATFRGNAMKVPDRIVLNAGSGESATGRDTNVGLENVGVNLDNYMGGMVTPPRTLTVDDTASRYMESRDGDNDRRRGGDFNRYEMLYFL